MSPLRRERATVVCPYTAVHPETAAALEGCGLEVRYFPMGEETSYYELLKWLWAVGETIVLNEHDVVPHPGALLELARCPRSWCAFAYPFLGGMSYAGLGCTKFGSELMRSHPTAVTDTLEDSDPWHPPGHWCTLDQRLAGSLREVPRHLHGPPVRHLKPDRTGHGCLEAGWTG